LLTVAMSAVALRTGCLLPRWLALVGIALGVALITPLAAHMIGDYTVGSALILLVVFAGPAQRFRGGRAGR
jgi:hypothetical protein